MLTAAEGNRRLHGELGLLRYDPLAYVMYAFPWDRPGSALAGEGGPQPWQRDVLEKLGEGLMSTQEAMRVAVASGHGIGKSALVSWIVLWALSTTRDTRGIVTANTEGHAQTLDITIRKIESDNALAHALEGVEKVVGAALDALRKTP